MEKWFHTSCIKPLFDRKKEKEKEKEGEKGQKMNVDIYMDYIKLQSLTWNTNLGVPNHWCCRFFIPVYWNAEEFMQHSEEGPSSAGWVGPPIQPHLPMRFTSKPQVISQETSRK